LEVVETVLKPVGDLSQMTLACQEVAEELGYQPDKFFLHRIIRKKYAPKSPEGSFAIAALPDRVIPKGIPLVELLVQILVDKYIDHLPLYRIQQRFTRNGIKIPNATIDNWVKTCIDRLLILYEYSQKLTKAQDYLQVDEATVKVQDKNLKDKTHLGYYWVYHAPVNGLLFFEYHSSRAGKYINKSLKNFKDYL
jgi:transposase